MHFWETTEATANFRSMHRRPKLTAEAYVSRKVNDFKISESIRYYLTRS